MRVYGPRGHWRLSEPLTRDGGLATIRHGDEIVAIEGKPAPADAPPMLAMMSAAPGPYVTIRTRSLGRRGARPCGPSLTRVSAQGARRIGHAAVDLHAGQRGPVAPDLGVRRRRRRSDLPAAAARSRGGRVLVRLPHPGGARPRSIPGTSTSARPANSPTIWVRNWVTACCCWPCCISRRAAWRCAGPRCWRELSCCGASAVGSGG